MMWTTDNIPWTVVGSVIVLLLAWLADRWVNKREDKKTKV